MAKYINAEDFFETFPDIDKPPYSFWAIRHIADVEDVVRCKNCLHECTCKITQYFGGEGYCSYGIRKKENCDSRGADMKGKKA